ncbi:MAG: T9SS type A sorting domain-containing protein, partial [Bacteroidota bacterium]
DPFDPYMDVIGADDFINIPLLERVITDTHYSDRERQGRHFAFLARLAAQWQDRSFGIASNDYVAVAVDEMGIARVFGDYPEFDDFAFFLQANCQPDFLPEMMEVGTPLTWNRGESAVKAYKVPGTWEGDYTFDLNDWQTGSGGSWENWFVQDGSLEIRTEVSDDCADILTNTEEWMQDDAIQIFPNPVREALTLNVPVDTERVQLFNAQGQMVHQSKLLTNLIDVSSLQSGTYTLVIDTPAGPFRQRFVKID